MFPRQRRTTVIKGVFYAVRAEMLLPEDRWGSVVSCICQKLVAKARVQFGNPKEGERPSLVAVTKQRQWRHDWTVDIVRWRTKAPDFLISFQRGGNQMYNLDMDQHLC
jgi:hypothetical protein